MLQLAVPGFTWVNFVEHLGSYLEMDKKIHIEMYIPNGISFHTVCHTEVLKIQMPFKKALQDCFKMF